MEIILINDGSTDSTLNICEEYKNKYKNIKLINFEQNNGIFIVRNAGLKQAKGKYISFVDSDDYIQDDMLNKLLDVAETTDVDIAVCNIK